MSAAQSRKQFESQFQTTSTCKECKQEKPLNQFYTYNHRNNSPYPRCKSCHKKWQNTRNKETSGEPPVHEQEIVRRLIYNQIAASHGRDMVQYPYVDIVAWNCVRIEAKEMKVTKRGTYYTSNTMAQRQNGWLADVVCILFQNELYFFEPDHPAFYIGDTLRSKILYAPTSLRSHTTDNRKLEVEDMLKAHNRFSLIEKARKAWMARQGKSKLRTLQMFPIEKAS